MSASDESPSLESNGNATGAEALKLLERVYPYIRHDPECPSTLDRGCECPVSILREQIEDLIATQHAPSVGPGNEAGADPLTEEIRRYEFVHEHSPDGSFYAMRKTFDGRFVTFENFARLRSELEQARELQIAVANQLGWMGPNESLLWKAWKHYDTRKLAEDCPSYAELALELPKLLSSLREVIEQKDEALRYFVQTQQAWCAGKSKLVDFERVKKACEAALATASPRPEQESKAVPEPGDVLA